MWNPKHGKLINKAYERRLISALCPKVEKTCQITALLYFYTLLGPTRALFYGKELPQFYPEQKA